MITQNRHDFGKMLKQRRLMIPMTLQKLGTTSDVSPSYLVRIEKGQRFPSAYVLRKIATPLGFTESELFALAGLLSPQPSSTVKHNSGERLDPYVAAVLSQEPLEVQRSALAIVQIFKSISKGITEENVRVP